MVAGEFLGCGVDDVAGVIVEGDGGEPDIDAAVAEDCAPPKTTFRDHGISTHWPATPFHSCGDVGDDGGVDEGEGDQNPEGEGGDKEVGVERGDVDGGGKEGRWRHGVEGDVTAAFGRMEEPLEREAGN